MATETEKLFNAGIKQEDIGKLTNEDVENILRDSGVEDRVEELEKRIAQFEQNPINRNIDIKSKDIIEEIISDRFFDIFWNDFFYYTMQFQSTDGFTINNSVVITSGTMILTTAGGGTDTASVDAGATIASGGNSFIEESRFKTNIVLDSSVNQAVFIGTGDCIGVGADSYGFNIEDATLKGFVQTNSSNRTTLSLQNISSATEYFLEALFYPGERIDFYVDEVLKGTISNTTNFPLSTTAQIWTADITEQTAATKVLRIHFFDYLQRKII